MMRQRKKQIITTVLVLAIIIFAGLNSNRFFRRIDMTENRVYTISRVSRDLFQEIPEIVHITYYRSDKLDDLSPIPRLVEDLLQEYTAHSRGKITMETADPAATGQEQMIEMMGLIPQQVEVVERNERSVARIYSGIVVRYLNKQEVIPLVSGTETLEYELTTKIRGLVKDITRTVGVVVGDASRSFEQDYQFLAEELGGVFEVEEIPLGEPIGPEVRAVIVLGDKDMNESHVEVIDRYVQNGGSVLFMVKPVYVDLNANLAATSLDVRPLEELLESYGITMETGLILDVYAKDFRVPTQMFGQMAWQIVGTYPYWIALIEENVSAEHPISARYAGLDVLWASPITVEEREGIETEIIATSSAESWVVRENYITNPYQAYMLSNPTGEQKERPVAVVISGLLPGLDGGSVENGRAMVISDYDCVSNVLQYSNSPYNLDFIENAVEWLGNDEELTGIKTRSVRDMRLNAIQNPAGERRVYLLAILVNLAVVPAVVILYGVRRFLRRRKRHTIKWGE
jgi:ABC-type uncharacterized transport system involved in gliding motility auxiliary subunit